MKHVLITGSSGMVGKGILLECLASASVDRVTLINRSPLGLEHPKVKEIILKDFMDVASVKNQLAGVDACFHCMGVSSIGLTEEQYSHFTYGITSQLADVCFELNPQMTFNYVSGMGSDSSEKGRTMWARVKGRTENYILNKGFARAYAFRPGYIIPENGIQSRTKLYNAGYVITRPLFPLLKRLKSITTTTRIGQAMINTMLLPQQQLRHLENSDINRMAEGGD